MTAAYHTDNGTKSIRSNDKNAATGCNNIEIEKNAGASASQDDRVVGVMAAATVAAFGDVVVVAECKKSIQKAWARRSRPKTRECCGQGASSGSGGGRVATQAEPSRSRRSSRASKAPREHRPSTSQPVIGCQAELASQEGRPRSAGGLSLYRPLMPAMWAPGTRIGGDVIGWAG